MDAENPSLSTASKREEHQASRVSKQHPQRDRIIGVVVVALLLLGWVAWKQRGLLFAARVNGDLISRFDVITELEKQSGRQALDSLITRKLIRDAAAKAKVVIAPDVVNAEIEKIKTRIKESGDTTTLEQILKQQGMDEAALRDQIILQKSFEALLGDKTAVTDEEVDKYMKDNKVEVPKGTDPDKFKDTIREELKSQKFGTAANAWIKEAKKNAHIEYWVGYGAPDPTDDNPVPAQPQQ